MSWIAHVKAYQKEHGCSYKEAMKGAKDSYTKQSPIKGNGLRSIARKMHGGATGMTDESKKIKNVMDWIIGSVFIFIALPIILELLYYRGFLRRRVAPAEVRAIANEVRPQIAAAAMEAVPDEVVRGAENV